MAGRKVLSAEKTFKINLEIGKHLMLLGNLAAGALVFGQTVSGLQFKPEVAIAGIAACIILYIVAAYIMKGGKK